MGILTAMRALSVSVLVLIPALMAAPAQARTDGSKPISVAVFAAATSVPVSTLDAVGAARVSRPAQFGREKLTDGPLIKDGKPEILSASLSWCPHCAANSWAIAVALDRFGSFSKLRTINTGTYHARNGAKPGYSYTKGLSFTAAGYSSEYITFTPVVVQDLEGRPVKQLTAAQKSALGFSLNGFPAMNIGGLYGTVGSGYAPGYLRGAKLTHLKIARAMHDPASPIAKRIGGLANFISAGICKATGGVPADVCTSTGVKAGEAKLPA